MLSFESIQADVEKWLAEIDYGKEPQNLYDPIRYSMSLGGKRLRPALCLATCGLFKDDYKQAKWPALALEVFHNFTLLHDDVMDKATIRRGKPTVASKYGLNTAILSGDAMLIEAYRLLQLTDSPSFSLITDAFNQVAREVCEGQQLDMDFETRDDVTPAEYLEMIRLKTAVLLATSIKIGALVGGATAQETQSLYDYGILIGLAFQLQDDILDSFGDPQTFGKAIGGDIMENKKTFLLLKAHEGADAQQRRELQAWMTNPEAVREEKVEAVKNIFEVTGAKDAAQQKVEQLFDQAMSKLREMEIPAEGKRYFIDYANKLFKRDK
ncbi:MAG: polyprenyl synthetase family protein [Bacteroidales bacterium]|nr:polyprenyl synthetase family protein [Bacteroidales bacterium]